MNFYGCLCDYRRHNRNWCRSTPVWDRLPRRRKSLHLIFMPVPILPRAFGPCWPRKGLLRDDLFQHHHQLHRPYGLGGIADQPPQPGAGDGLGPHDPPREGQHSPRLLPDAGGRRYPASVWKDGGGNDVPSQVWLQRRPVPHQRRKVYGGKCGLVLYRVPRQSGAGGGLPFFGDGGWEDRPSEYFAYVIYNCEIKCEDCPQYKGSKTIAAQRLQ